ncbi:MAG: tetratricopeptide repeat protein [Gammaproteobacteria bacterium]|jgi:tetratricopeptide (TPR) repeat protein
MNVQRVHTDRLLPKPAQGLALLLALICNAVSAQTLNDQSEPAPAGSQTEEQGPAAVAVVPDESVLMTPEEQLDDAQARFLGYYEDELYQLALTAGRQVLQLAREIYGNNSVPVALALINIANTQSKLGDLPAARGNFERSIYLIEDAEGIVSPRLINPLMGLAAAHNALGDYDRGLTAYKRALRINHVELGLKNMEQMTIRDGITESYVGLGDMDEADFQQEAQVRIIRDKYGNDLEALLPATYKLAEWYRRSGQPEKESLLLQNAIRTVKQVSGDDSAKQIEALRGMASAYQRLDMPAECLRALKRALRISEETEPEDRLLTAEIQVEIGDFYNGFGDRREARDYYQRAWVILADENATDAQQRYFGAPVIISSVDLPQVYPMNSKTSRLYLEDPDRFAEGQLLLRYNVDENGRVDDIKIVESNPPDLMDKRISYLLGRFLYRPRLVEGEPVLTANIDARHRFSYLRPDAEKSAEKGDANAANDDADGRLSYPAQEE